MAKETYHGPLEQVDECCWRIPGATRGHARRRAHLRQPATSGTAQEGPGAEQVPTWLSCRHPARQPGHAGHPLGLRLLHRRRLRHRSGRGRRHLARRGCYDINCGVRLMRSNLFYRDVKPHLRQLVDTLFSNVPTGVGKSGHYEFRARNCSAFGRRVAILVGRGWPSSATSITPGSRPPRRRRSDAVSDRAKMRGAEQCGTSARATISSRCSRRRISTRMRAVMGWKRT